MSVPPTWTTDDIGDLSGRRAVVTGVTGGLGWSTAYELAKHGAEVVAAGRDLAKVDDALTDLRTQLPDASLDSVQLDLADLDSVEEAAETLLADGQPIHVLVNNAGIMATPQRSSAQGYELQMATNHLGHFALTARLWPRLVDSSARVVSVSSLMHTFARRIDLRGLEPGAPLGRYERWSVYAQSKLANLQFALELDRRARAAGAPVTSVAAHPGYAHTNLQTTGPQLGGVTLQTRLVDLVTRIVSQPAHAGAWPLERAATEPGLPGGSYVGPSRMRQMRGAPRLVGMTAAARDTEQAAALWAASERAAHVDFAPA
ncbi:short-subunit dehydrogenase [Mumia flava]|uniref:Short-subunit dehydrogenase n=1 Tax=Mumia flava TaxID=1348852 RepID=A0A2M9AQ66_9ACTN|nr:oxidoreductase [Mumia flava]PJJ47845.1 short-subunit dehydrogenase [Mumia flava]